MHTRGIIPSMLGAALVGWSALCSAEEAPAPKPPTFLPVDFESLPIGSLPPPPPDAAKPASVPKGSQVAGLTVAPAPEARAKTRSMASAIRAHKNKKRSPRKVMMLQVEAPELAALYVPSENVSEFDGDGAQRLSCDDRESVSSLRWEKLTLTPDGQAELAIQDVWFDSHSCAVAPGTASIVKLKAVAWEGTEPWLFAMRGETSLTLVMPKADDLTAGAMVGSTQTVRAGFTRVTLPLGRWGSGSIVANVRSLAFASPTDGGSGPLELTVELVQTMSEISPTLLVQTRSSPVASQDVD